MSNYKPTPSIRLQHLERFLFLILNNKVFLIIISNNYGQFLDKSTSKQNFYKTFIPRLGIFKCKDYSIPEIIFEKDNKKIQIELEKIF